MVNLSGWMLNAGGGLCTAATAQCGFCCCITPWACFNAWAPSWFWFKACYAARRPAACHHTAVACSSTTAAATQPRVSPCQHASRTK